MHLKVIQTMQKIPRSIGIPPLSDSAFDQALALQANAALASSASSSAGAGPSSGAGFNLNLSLGDDDGKINPLAGMGLTDEQYTMILHNMVAGEGFGGLGGLGGMAMGMGLGMGLEKRGLDDAEDGRDGKRGRFEVIE